ncbi:GTPase IMAP family member 4-like [Alosa alosa]|uniref:GTPase IMAP family member 4-like n=1 Tax=Alosa alosa TaxID=278164 RepID=UPI0020151534|nr:GTPase IMAP family member 4-like [Alosa alosa]
MDRGYVPKHDLRIVLLGQAGPWKGLVSKDIMGLWCDGSMCLEREESGRTVTMVMTQGWDSDSEHTGGGAVEQEVMRSVTLCPPGPHALLLALPMGPDVGIARRDVERAQQHMSFLSERAWRHTMVVFICTYRIMSDKILLDRHILGQLVNKCGGGHSIIFVDRPNSELLQKVDQMAARNRQRFLQHHEVKGQRPTMEAELPPALNENLRNRRGIGSPGPRPGTTA